MNAWTPTSGLREAFARLSAKTLAHKARTSVRTAENWKQGTNGPSWPAVVELLRDPEMATILLRAAGRDDLADIEQAREKLRQAKNALQGLDQ